MDISYNNSKLDTQSVSQHQNKDRNWMSSLEESALYDMKDYKDRINFECPSPTQVKKRSGRRGQDRTLHLQEGTDCLLEGADVSPCIAQGTTRPTPRRYTPQHHAALTMTLTTITVILTLHLVLLGDPVTAQDNQEKILLPTLDGEYCIPLLLCYSVHLN